MGKVSGPKPESGCDLKHVMFYLVANTIPDLLSTGTPSPFVFNKIPSTQQQSLIAENAINLSYLVIDQHSRQLVNN